MGNACLHLPTAPTTVRLVYWGGHTRLLTLQEDVVTAGDVVDAADLPAAADHVVCRADSFFVGLPIPVMSPGEELVPGRTYFVLPAERFSSLKVLTAATLAALSAAPPKKKTSSLAGPGQCPFEYVKGATGGAALIRVLPEFIEKLITCDDDGSSRRDAGHHGLCTTPELKRHYAQLVGSRNQQWSPRLDTISESHKSRWLRLFLSSSR